MKGNAIIAKKSAGFQAKRAMGGGLTRIPGFVLDAGAGFRVQSGRRAVASPGSPARRAGVAFRRLYRRRSRAQAVR